MKPSKYRIAVFLEHRPRPPSLSRLRTDDNSQPETTFKHIQTKLISHSRNNVEIPEGHRDVFNKAEPHREKRKKGEEENGKNKASSPGSPHRNVKVDGSMNLREANREQIRNASQRGTGSDVFKKW